MSLIARLATAPTPGNTTITPQQHIDALYGNCTKATCPIYFSFWGYLPSRPINICFMVFFAISTIIFTAQASVYRRYTIFNLAMICGGAAEVLGYTGRILSWYNPWSESAFLIQMVSLTIAPSFYAAGIYLCLSRIVETFGAANSRIPPIWYPRIFVFCDCVSLLLQAIGGGGASIATHHKDSPDLGDHIMVAGMAFQVFTMLIFISLASDFAFRTFMRYRMLGELAFDKSNDELRRSKRFNGFLVALAVATLCVFLRCIYRAAELGQGWTGYLIMNQKYFIAMESSPVALSALLLNIYHPGFCFRQLASTGLDEKGILGDEVESIITSYSDDASLIQAKRERRKFQLGTTVTEIDPGIGSPWAQQCQIQLVEASPDQWKLQVKAASRDQWKISWAATDNDQWNIILTASKSSSGKLA